MLNQSNDKNFVFAVKSVKPKTTKESTMELWHKKLGYVSLVVLARNFDMPKQSMCKISKSLVCPYAKQTRLQFPSSSIKSGAYFDLTHVDLWSSSNTPTFDGNKYLTTIVDDYSWMT